MSIIDVGRKPVVVAASRGRPTVGLVLGSGAARGFAHIGVIHALREHGILPDIIVGTSMGALVGGCYANGQLDQLEVWARSLTLRRILGYLDIRIGSSGLIGGGRLARRLEQAIGNTSIEDLPVRFAAIAGAGWSMARWSIRSRSRRRAPLARASLLQSTSTPIASPAAPPSPAMARTRRTNRSLRYRASLATDFPAWAACSAPNARCAVRSSPPCCGQASPLS